MRIRAAVAGLPLFALSLAASQPPKPLEAERKNIKVFTGVPSAKQRARAMILMTRAINDANFGGRTMVTCQTCHHGATTPVSVPQIGSTVLNTTRRMPDEPLPAPLPSAADVFARYEGATHVSTLSSARVTVEGCHARVVDAGTPRAHVVPRAVCNTGENLSRFDDAGNRAVTTSPLPDGRSVRVGSDGRRAWTLGPDGLH